MTPIASRLCLALLGGTLAAGLPVAACSQDEPSPASGRMTGQELLDFRAVIQHARAKVFPSVVYIRCVRESLEGGKRLTQEISGSGVIVSPDGEVVTNWHVIDKAIRVRCLLSDGQALEADIIGSDQSTDLAVIKLRLPRDVSPLPFAEFGQSTVLREGDFVMAMGAPWGLNRSVSIGIISCTRRFLPEISEYSLWLQTDSAINPGNSGGPLVNTDGEIIGINARGMDFAEGMGFAIPAETVQVLIPQLRDYGKVNWSWTGLQLQPLRDFNRDMYFDDTEGVIIAETDADSPARQAGLKPRDRIVRVNGTPITAMTEEDLPAARRFFGLLPMHEPATFEVERDNEILTVEITPRQKGQVQGQELALPRWDLTIKEINQFDNPDLHFHRKEGVFVFGVKWPGNAGNAGIREKDIITKIDGRDVTTLDDVKAIHTEAIANVDAKYKMVFTVLRGGLPRHIVLDYSRDFEKR